MLNPLLHHIFVDNIYCYKQNNLYPKLDEPFSKYDLYEIFKKDSTTANNHFENGSGSYEIFLRVSIFETKWFGMAAFFSVRIY
jgi:hypothetical protein